MKQRVVVRKLLKHVGVSLAGDKMKRKEEHKEITVILQIPECSGGILAHQSGHNKSIITT